MTEEDTFNKLRQTQFGIVWFDINFCSDAPYSVILSRHNWTREEYDKASKEHMSDFVTRYKSRHNLS